MDDLGLYTDSDGVGECMSCGNKLFSAIFDSEAEDEAALIALKCAKCEAVYRPYHANN